MAVVDRLSKFLMRSIHKFRNVFCTRRYRIRKQQINPTHADYRQDDTLGDDADLVYAAVMGEDGSIAMAGVGAEQFKVIKLDADGSFDWIYQVQYYRRPAPLNDTTAVKHRHRYVTYFGFYVWITRYTLLACTYVCRVMHGFPYGP